MLCEASRIEVFFSFWYSSKKLLTKSPVSGSRDAVGSSRRRTDGSLIIDLAKSIINDPSVLLLDEPTASLDPETGDFVRSFLEEYQKEKKTSILLASHNMAEVERLCSSVLMMNKGSIIDQGTPGELIKKHGRRNMEEVFLKLTRDLI